MTDLKKKILEGVGVKGEGQKAVSYSQYSVYNECPYRWSLTYKERMFPFTSSVSSVFGTSLHECCQEWLRLLHDVSVKASEEFPFEDYLSTRLLENYKKEMEANGGNHFIEKNDLKEHYADGINILNYLRKKRKILFDYRQYELVAIELPLYVPILEEYDVLFNGYIDLLFYNKEEKTFRIVDIKTSTRGWSDWQKKDQFKMSQVLLYKHYLSKHYSLNSEDISGEYLIVKRKIPDNTEWVIPRHSVHIPAQGASRIKLATQGVEDFIKQCFNKDGTYIEQHYSKTPGKACKFCPYANTKHCNMVAD